MRFRLLVAEMIDRVLVQLNFKTISESVENDDTRRADLLGTDTAIHEQARRTQAFAEEISGKL